MHASMPGCPVCIVKLLLLIWCFSDTSDDDDDDEIHTHTAIEAVAALGVSGRLSIGPNDASDIRTSFVKK